MDQSAWENKRESYEVLRPREMSKALRSWEVQISLEPTVQVSNGLPYPFTVG